MIYTYVAGTDIKPGQAVGFGADGKLYPLLPFVTEGVGTAYCHIVADELVTFSHDEETDVRSHGVLINGNLDKRVT